MVGDNPRLGNDNAPCHGFGYHIGYLLFSLILGLKKRDKGTVRTKITTSDDPYESEGSRELNTFH